MMAAMSSGKASGVQPKEEHAHPRRLGARPVAGVRGAGERDRRARHLPAPSKSLVKAIVGSCQPIIAPAPSGAGRRVLRGSGAGAHETGAGAVLRSSGRGRA